MIYLTYSDPLTGVYQSQVIDVCNYLSKTFNIKVRLVSLISIKGFWKTRKEIKSLSNNSIVVPMFPTIILWKLNAITLFLIFIITGERALIARGVLACNMALILKSLHIIRKVCYDGRSAVSSEYIEYNVSPYRSLIPVIKKAEKKAVLKSDFKISVSQELIKYWKSDFQYTGNNHVIIPSTVNSEWTLNAITETKKSELRRQLGLPIDKIIIVYSGSTAGWQSFDLMRHFMSNIIQNQPQVQFLLLSKSSRKLAHFQQRFPDNYVEKWIHHNEVEKYLIVCDYGLLIRDESMTNQVASPVKFAEYLSAGLNVLISKNIGDLSAFVKNNRCGLVIEKNTLPKLEFANDEQRTKNNNLVKMFFTKEAYFSQYKICIDYLMNKK